LHKPLNVTLLFLAIAYKQPLTLKIKSLSKVHSLVKF